MISHVDHADELSCVCKAYIPADSPYICDGSLLPEMLPEIMAQAFAAGAGNSGLEVNGFLAAITSFEVEGAARAEDWLTVNCRILRKIGSISLIAGEIFNQENRKLASAEFRIFTEESE